MRRLMRGFAAAVAAASMVSTASYAQEELVVENEVQESSGERTEMTVIAGDGFAAPMIFSTTETLGSGEGPAIRMMAAPGAGFSFSGGGDFSMPAPDPWSLLGNPSVQKDLELVGDQLQRVKDMQAEMGRQMKEKIGDLSKGGIGPERFAGLGELMKKLRAEQKEQLSSVLLPHQIDRLKQVALQTHMKQSGTANALASELVAEELGISDDQKERLQKRQKEIKEKLAQQIEELKKKAKDELLMELTPDQRGKLKKMVGDEYKPNNQDWTDSIRDRIKTRRGKK